MDGTGLVESLVIQVQKAMVEHCAAVGTRCAVLDALRGKSAQALIDSQLKPLQLSAIGPVNAALYTPWIRTISSGSTLVPPSGQICGIIARTDAVAGVFTAPANVEVQDATDLEADLDPDSMAQLFDRGVNCIRAFTARGIRASGARTLSRDAEWRHLNVRRLVLTVLRWIDVNMTWAALEPERSRPVGSHRA